MSIIQFIKGLKSSYSAEQYPGGIFFATDEKVIYVDGIPYGATPEYDIVKLTNAKDGYAASYQLQKNGEGVGTVIDIPKDLVVSAGSVKEVSTVNEPYEGAAIGDLYIELILANSTSDPIYVPVNKLVDKYVGDAYVTVNGNHITFNYSNVVEEIKKDIALSDIVANIESKASKSDVVAIDALIAKIEDVNAKQTLDISNLQAKVETLKVNDVDTTVSSGIALTLKEGVIGVEANLATNDIKLSGAIGTDVEGTSLQTTLENLNSRLSSVVSERLISISSGYGLEVSGVENNSQKISLKVKENAGIAIDEDGLHLV